MAQSYFVKYGGLVEIEILLFFPVKSPSKPPSLESESHFCQMSLSPTNLWSHAGLDFCVCVVVVFLFIADVWELWQCASYHTHAHSANSGNYSINDKNIPQTTLTACSALGTSHNQHNRIHCVMSKCVVASEFHYTNAWLAPLYRWSFFIFILFQFFIFWQKKEVTIFHCYCCFVSMNNVVI